MTDNDLIAEYIREKRPEILTSYDFVFWRIGRQIRSMADGIVKAFQDNKAFFDACKEFGNAEEDEDGRAREESQT